MNVIIIANTIIAKQGNIGFRIAKIEECSTSEQLTFTYICRGGPSKEEKYIGSPLISFFGRSLNAVKIYLFRNINARYYDFKIFELFSHFKLKKLLKNLPKDATTVVHLLEPSDKLIKLCHRFNVKVLLDFPIAPNAYVEVLKEEYMVKMTGNTKMLPVELAAIESADKVIAPSSFVSNEVKKLVSNKLVTIVPFGTYLKDYNKDFDINFEEIHFCFAGNLSKRKGVEILLEAWESFRETRHKLYLCGRIYPDIKKVLDEKRFENVITPGFVDLSSYLKSSDVYVFPSLMEGSSKSIYEAMSCSLPIITTFESGSIVDDSSEGFIIPKCNADSIVESMLKYVQDPSLIKNHGANAKNKVRSYTWEQYSKNIIQCYSNFS